jgi:hypothetical protein
MNFGCTKSALSSGLLQHHPHQRLRRDLCEVPEGHLTFFEGDELCHDCACGHGVL